MLYNTFTAIIAAALRAERNCLPFTMIETPLLSKAGHPIEPFTLYLHTAKEEARKEREFPRQKNEAGQALKRSVIMKRQYL